jgi:hypothetical protein
MSPVTSHGKHEREAIKRFIAVLGWEHDAKFRNIFRIGPNTIGPIFNVNFVEVNRDQAGFCIQDLLEDPPQGLSELHQLCRDKWNDVEVEKEKVEITHSAHTPFSLKNNA